jgi:hypothetical protein
MSFLDEIAARLVASGVGAIATPTVPGVIYMGSRANIPSGDGPYITITETGGSDPTRTQNQPAAATQRPTAQILTRAKSYQIARTKARAAYLALDGIFNTTLSGTFYLSVKARQEPTDLGELDGAGRAMISFNIEAEKHAS